MTDDEFEQERTSSSVEMLEMIAGVLMILLAFALGAALAFTL